MFSIFNIKVIELFFIYNLRLKLLLCLNRIFLRLIWKSSIVWHLKECCLNLLCFFIIWPYFFYTFIRIIKIICFIKISRYLQQQPISIISFTFLLLLFLLRILFNVILNIFGVLDMNHILNLLFVIRTLFTSYCLFDFLIIFNYCRISIFL